MQFRHLPRQVGVGMSRPRKYFGGYCPEAKEKSVVLGGALVLHPIPNPADVTATLHEYTQRIWDLAYAQGRADVAAEIKRSLGLK